MEVGEFAPTLQYFYASRQERKALQAAPVAAPHFVCISIGTHALCIETMYSWEMLSSYLGTGQGMCHSVAVLSFSIILFSYLQPTSLLGAQTVTEIQMY